MPRSTISGTAIDLDGKEMILDADQDTTITADTDDTIDFKIAGVEHISLSNSSGSTVIKPRVDAKDVIFQQFDGNEVARISDGRKLKFFDDGGESITSDGSNLKLESGGTTFTVPASDGSNGQFLKTNGSGTLSFGSVTLTTINNNADNRIITGSGTADTLEGETGLTYSSGTMAQASGDFTLDVGGDIILDADGANVTIKDGGTSILDIANNSSDVELTVSTADKNFKIKGTDGSSAITALDIDIAEAGLATFNAGAGFGGSVLPSADDTYDLGSSSKQWRDIYTGDINLNNTKTRDNEVDGTRGSWTIQEGKDDLYILNRLNGKKYRFKLEEMK